MADDDEELCEEMAEILRQEGYSVTSVFNGLAARDLLASNDYDVVLLDFKMPGMNGFELLRFVKKCKPESRVLLLTGRHFGHKNLDGDEYDAAMDIVALADGYINKPFDIQNVLDTIKSLLTTPRRT
jgi:DNA-binding response OmpR family regulator